MKQKKKKQIKEDLKPLNQLNSYDLFITKHFFQRWNRRIKSNQFKSIKELGLYLRSIHGKNKLIHLSEDVYMYHDFMVIAKRSNDKFYFVSIYGTKKDNPMIYNFIHANGHERYKQVLRKYGKITLISS